MDCIIIRPPFEHTGFDQDTQESLGAAYLLASLRNKGFSACLLDGELQNLTVREIAEAVNRLKPAVAGFSIMAEYAVESAAAIAEMTDCTAIHLTAGGYLPSFFPEEIFRSIPELDSIVQFEGERVLADLVKNTLLSRPLQTPGITIKDHAGGVRRTEPDGITENLDSLPLPHRDALPQVLEREMPAAVSTSRGCSGACTFCSIKKFCMESCGIPLRQRSAGNVIRELCFLREVHGVRSFHFTDDDFIGNRDKGFDRAFTLAEMIKEKCPGSVFRFECRPDLVDRNLFGKLKDAGLAGVFLGIDSSVERTRRLYNKNCPMETVEESIETIRSLGLDLDTGFIPFHPDVTLDEVLADYSFLFRHNLDNLHTLLNRLYCTGESPLSGKLTKQGLLRQENSFELAYDFTDSRVALLHETASVALKPLFPAWYDIYKERRRAFDLFRSGSVNADELHRKELILKHANIAARKAVQKIAAYASEGGGPNLLSFTREIRKEVKEKLTGSGDMP